MAEIVAEFAPHAADLEKTVRNPQIQGVNLPRDAFKEWAIVCDSIERGETSLIFRKGGIAEGRDGFYFRFSRFFLFPTFFHEQIERTRLGNDRTLEPNPDSVKITSFVEVEFVRWVQNLALLENLDRFHVLKSSVLSERFHYDDRKGIHVAFLRAHLITPTWQFPLQRSYGGCRSWLELPQPPIDLATTPVLSSEEHERRRSMVLATLREEIESEIEDGPTS